MMPWWFWILLWVVLALAALVFILLCGIHLYRKFMRMFEEVTAAGDALALPPGEPLEEELPDGRRPAAGPANLFRDPAQARADYDAGKASRRDARRLRRVGKKRARGQAQRVRDLYPRDVDL